MPEIKGDYQGSLKTIKATADAKLETVSAIEAGSAIIGNIDRVATVGQIDHLGTVEHVNRIDDFGTIKNIPQVYDLDYAGYYDLLAESIGLITSPGLNSGTFMPLAVNAGGKLILDTLGTVERVKDIDNLGTVGRLETIGMIEAGTISEVGHVGTIGDINHLGSIGNTSFDQGSVSDHKREMYGWDESDWEKVRTDTGGKLKTAPATSMDGGVGVCVAAGTAYTMYAASKAITGVVIKAMHENLGTVFVGDSGVDADHGYALRRDEFVSFSFNNLGSVYIYSSRANQKVHYLWVNY